VDLSSSGQDLVPDPATLRGRFPGSWRSDHHRAALSPRSTLQVRRQGLIQVFEDSFDDIDIVDERVKTTCRNWSW